jgi:hypothetical protein
VESSGEHGKTFRFHKVLGNYRIATQLVASQVALSSTELVIAETTSLLDNEVMWIPPELLFTIQMGVKCHRK